MMVEDGTLKPAPSDDELHPASVPSAGASATLSSTDRRRAATPANAGGRHAGVAAERRSEATAVTGHRRLGGAVLAPPCSLPC